MITKNKRGALPKDDHPCLLDAYKFDNYSFNVVKLDGANGITVLAPINKDWTGDRYEADQFNKVADISNKIPNDLKKDDIWTVNVVINIDANDVVVCFGAYPLICKFNRLQRWEYAGNINIVVKNGKPIQFFVRRLTEKD
jgi:hypothetical protein